MRTLQLEFLKNIEKLYKKYFPVFSYDLGLYRNMYFIPSYNEGRKKYKPSLHSNLQTIQFLMQLIRLLLQPNMLTKKPILLHQLPFCSSCSNPAPPIADPAQTAAYPACPMHATDRASLFA